MRILAILTVLLAPLFAGTALADDAEGKITKINEDTETITLDNGKDYRLPGEFDYSAIEKCMKVIVTYDLVDNVRYISNIDEADGG
ncbi:DUF1344 domain-containing protein [Pseudochrobactrum saccharolyticum]|uniref:DUF1344 domain-containing protein n=1 Tax=Pseudochrobactrum saccharolyticum TaxID=354352 RepID=UPI0027601F42|nr:DUF1344 domain-containing protein [Pseudochrobactrum saccharolyticum]MDP8251546.1 DUF1344 domain-containing protein [Pseudochrobactrum saccharolyticum]